MKLQQLFDDVSLHLLTQNAIADDAGNSCVYRSLDGLKCAVGSIIPDDFYDHSMEGTDVSELIWHQNTYPELRTYLMERY